MNLAAGPPLPRRPWWLRHPWAALCGLIALLIAAYYGWIFWQLWELRTHSPQTTAFMQIGLERVRLRNPGARLQQRWVPYERISPNLKRAVIAAEDQRFLEHHGFDVEAIEKAYAGNSRKGHIRRGGSTISQQLARNLFLSPQRTYVRKAQEAVITMMIEAVLSKRRILEIYLNVIEWGDGIYGAEAAAWHYYREPAADLDPDEAAELAAMIPSPRRYTYRSSTPYLEQRTETLLREMRYVRTP